MITAALGISLIGFSKVATIVALYVLLLWFAVVRDCCLKNLASIEVKCSFSRSQRQLCTFGSLASALMLLSF